MSMASIRSSRFRRRRRGLHRVLASHILYLKLNLCFRMMLRLSLSLRLSIKVDVICATMDVDRIVVLICDKMPHVRAVGDVEVAVAADWERFRHGWLVYWVIVIRFGVRFLRILILMCALRTRNLIKSRRLRPSRLWFRRCSSLLALILRRRNGTTLYSRCVVLHLALESLSILPLRLNQLRELPMLNRKI
jgi:hypothetical protein